MEIRIWLHPDMDEDGSSLVPARRQYVEPPELRQAGYYRRFSSRQPDRRGVRLRGLGVEFRDRRAGVSNIAPRARSNSSAARRSGACSRVRPGRIIPNFALVLVREVRSAILPRLQRDPSRARRALAITAFEVARPVARLLLQDRLRYGLFQAGRRDGRRSAGPRRRGRRRAARTGIQQDVAGVREHLAPALLGDKRALHLPIDPVEIVRRRDDQSGLRRGLVPVPASSRRGRDRDIVRDRLRDNIFAGEPDSRNSGKTRADGRVAGGRSRFVGKASIRNVAST